VSRLVVICVALLLFVLFYVLFVCKCVLYYVSISYIGNNNVVDARKFKVEATTVDITVNILPKFQLLLQSHYTKQYLNFLRADK